MKQLILCALLAIILPGCEAVKKSVAEYEGPTIGFSVGFNGVSGEVKFYGRTKSLTLPVNPGPVRPPATPFDPGPIFDIPGQPYGSGGKTPVPALP